jgi:hypothetical protein
MVMTLAVIVMLAIFVERIIEQLGGWIPSKAKPFASAGLGIIMCVAFNADMIQLAFQFISKSDIPASRIPFLGNVVTGIVVGGGSNYLNDFWTRIMTVPLGSVPIQVLKEMPPGSNLRTESRHTVSSPADSPVDTIFTPQATIHADRIDVTDAQSAALTTPGTEPDPTGLPKV